MGKIKVYLNYKSYIYCTGFRKFRVISVTLVQKTKNRLTEEQLNSCQNALGCNKVLAKLKKKYIIIPKKIRGGFNNQI